jgi:hypothetical protein
VTAILDCTGPDLPDEAASPGGVLDRSPVRTPRRFVDLSNFLDHVANLALVLGVGLVMAGLGMVFVHVVEVVSPQCLIDAQGACAKLPDLSAYGLVAGGIGLVHVVAAAVMKRLLP